MKRFKITEEQYKSALKEGVTLKADVQAANGDVKKAIDNSTKVANEVKASDSKARAKQLRRDN